jgi:hypothetical protein
VLHLRGQRGAQTRQPVVAGTTYRIFTSLNPFIVPRVTRSPGLREEHLAGGHEVPGSNPSVPDARGHLPLWMAPPSGGVPYHNCRYGTPPDKPALRNGRSRPASAAPVATLVPGPPAIQHVPLLHDEAAGG